MDFDTKINAATSIMPSVLGIMLKCLSFILSGALLCSSDSEDKVIFMSFSLKCKWDFSQINKVTHTQKALSASFKHPTLSKLHFHEWWILALDGRMKYSITLFSCANEAECGFRGFLFSKVACLVMHMLPSYVSFHVSVYTQAVVLMGNCG